MSDSIVTGDFFDHAVRKALGSANVVAPRLPSLYEPSAPSASGREIEARFEDEEIGALPVEQSGARAAVRAVLPAAKSAREDARSAHEPVPLPRHDPAIAGGVVDRRLRDMPGDHGTAEDPRPLPGRTAPAFDAHAMPFQPAPFATMAGDAALLASDTAALRTERPAPVVSSDAARVDARAQRVPHPGSPLMIAQPVPLGSLAEPSSRDRRNPEPVIQVTIGRVEVRAVREAATPATPRRAPQPMRLDEYLNQRRDRQ